MQIRRGDIFYVDLDPVRGSEQGGSRPVLVVQNNTGNQYSNTVIVAPISSAEKRPLPVHTLIMRSDVLPKRSVVLAEQLRTIDISRFGEYVGRLSNKDMDDVDMSLKISIGVI